MAHIKQAFIYEILKQYNRGEISFGRFCELINEEAKEMKTLKKIEVEPVFVEFIPELNDMEENKLYISLEYNTASHLCLCGCGNLVVTPLNHGNYNQGWNLTNNDGKISLSPSIGNYNFPCRYHYVLTNNVANVV